MTDLAELGLSSYEEQAYRTLLVTGAVTASELSEASGVPRGRIYDVLNGLEARDAVRTQASDPRRYVAVEPDRVVEALLAERTAELEHERRRYESLADGVRSGLLPSPPTDSSFWLGSLGSEQMATAMGQHVATARDSIVATIGSPYENATWECLEPEVGAFFEALDHDVDVRLVVSEAFRERVPEQWIGRLQDDEGSVRTVPSVEVSFDVLDDAMTTVDVPHPLAPDDRLGVVGITDADVVERFERHFDQLWARGEPLAD